LDPTKKNTRKKSNKTHQKSHSFPLKKCHEVKSKISSTLVQLTANLFLMKSNEQQRRLGLEKRKE